MKNIIITGISGQDGSYLKKYLLKKDYNIIGIDYKDIHHESQTPRLTNIKANITEYNSINTIIQQYRPIQIYHLAALHESSEKKTNQYINFNESLNVNFISTMNILNSILKTSPETKVFFASSSQIFGEQKQLLQDEESVFNPNNIYGLSKSFATQLCRYYRKYYSLFISVGILYGHESPLRKDKFASKKIVKSAVEIKKGKRKKLILGNLDAKIDWGYAGDYVVAMYEILQQKQPTDYVISSGSISTIRDFVKMVFQYLDLEWEKYVEIDKSIIHFRKNSFQGSNSKLLTNTGWNPTVNIKELAELMIEYELKRISSDV